MKEETGKYRLFTRLAGVMLLAILLFLMIPLSYRVTLPFVYWVNQFIFFLLLIALAYFNTKKLAPKLLFRKKYFQYYLILLGACILIILLLWQTENWLNVSEGIKNIAAANEPQPKHGTGILSVALYIFLVEVLVLGVNIAGIIIQKLEEEKNIRLNMEKEKIDIELSFLKSQINPHFFFNSLNTINALTYSDVAQARDALKKLGKIMRHVLYKSSNEFSTLGEEIEFIKTYLELMKLRMSPRVSILFSTNVEHSREKIAPMIFLPFIENCFKHGVSTQAESPIVITIEKHGHELVFLTKNKAFERPVDNEIIEGQNHGIGMKNTKRRLGLLYPNQYSLLIKRGDEFEILLKIELK